MVIKGEKMKNRYAGLILWVSVSLFLYSVSCTSLKDKVLKENPDFEKNADKFILTTPIKVNSSSSNKFVIEDISSNMTYEVAVDVENPKTDISVMENYQKDDKHISKTKEFTALKFFVENPFNNNEYEVIGKVTRFKTNEDKEKTSSETSVLNYPIEFWIFKDARDAGKIAIYEPEPSLSQKIYISFNDKQVEVEYQDMLGKRTFSFNDDTGLIALIALKPKGTVATKMTGDFLIKESISEHFKLDIISMYLMSESVFGVIHERPF
jgi:hypothetical protein